MLTVSNIRQQNNLQIEYNNKIQYQIIDQIHYTIMWKNQTSPDLHKKLKYFGCKTQHNNVTNICQLSFQQLQSKQQHSQPRQHPLSIAFPAISSKNPQSDYQNTRQYISNSFDSKFDDKSQYMSGCRNVSKQKLILKELQQNQQLKINLYRAEKTIMDLDSMCKVMHDKIVQMISNKKSQMENKFATGTLSIPANIVKQQTNIHKTNKNKQNRPEIASELKKKGQIEQIWKNCYQDLIEYVTKYTKDITFLTQQYKVLQAKAQNYKKSQKKNKKNQQHLLRILHESSIKLQKSQQTANKLVNDLKQRDKKIQQYHIQSKNLKIKILEYLQQIQRIKRDNKISVLDSQSYKQTCRSMQEQINLGKNKFRQLQIQLSKKQKAIQMHRYNQKMLEQRIRLLEEQLKQCKRFNQNLMSQYKTLTHKVQSNQQKICEKYQAAENLYEQRTKQYEKYIDNIKKQKQIYLEKNQLKLQKLQEQLQKYKIIHNSLQKQLSERSCIIIQLELEINQNKQKSINMELDLKAHINQKDRQIQYLEELKDIGLQKNEQLKAELQQVRADMLIIIQQLKLKELEVQKYKTYSDYSSLSQKNIVKKYSVKTIGNIQGNPNFNTDSNSISKTDVNKRKNSKNNANMEIETNPSKDRRYNRCVQSIDNTKSKTILKITSMQPIKIQQSDSSQSPSPSISASVPLSASQSCKNKQNPQNYDAINNIKNTNSNGRTKTKKRSQKTQNSFQGIVWKKRNKKKSSSYYYQPSLQNLRQLQPQPQTFQQIQKQSLQHTFTHHEANTNQFQQYQCNQFLGIQQFEELKEQINQFIPQNTNQVNWNNIGKKINLNQIIIDDINDLVELQTPKIWRNSSPNAPSFAIDTRQQKFFQKMQPVNKTQTNLQKVRGQNTKAQPNRQKFSLQSFQNKIMMQENAKLLLSMNNISFR